MTKRKKFDIYAFLTHAIWHCQWGSAPIDRRTDEADMQAAKILTDLRSEITREELSKLDRIKRMQEFGISPRRKGKYKYGS